MILIVLYHSFVHVYHDDFLWKMTFSLLLNDSPWNWKPPSPSPSSADVSAVRPVYAPKDFLEVLLAVRDPNCRVSGAGDVPKWACCRDKKLEIEVTELNSSSQADTFFAKQKLDSTGTMHVFNAAPLDPTPRKGLDFGRNFSVSSFSKPFGTCRARLGEGKRECEWKLADLKAANLRDLYSFEVEEFRLEMSEAEKRFEMKSWHRGLLRVLSWLLGTWSSLLVIRARIESSTLLSIKMMLAKFF